MTIIAQVIKVVATQDVKLSLITIVDGKLGLELKHGYEVKKGDILTILLANFYSYKSYFAEYQDLNSSANTSNVAIEGKAEEVSDDKEEDDSDDDTLNPNIPVKPKGRPKTK
jgi:hypothetical protein